jgi:predicted small secreted protein
MNLKTKSVAVLLLGAALFSCIVTGCNTTKGFGQDVEKLGDKIEKKASR